MCGVGKAGSAREGVAPLFTAGPHELQHLYDSSPMDTPEWVWEPG